MSDATPAAPAGPGFQPSTSAGAKAFIVTPFARLARAHAVSAAADAMVATALAGSVFFSQPTDGARGGVLRYLLITMLPFAVVSPLVGPLIDRLRSGHRYVVIGTQVLRAGFCFLMISTIKSGNAIFFLEALGFLVMQKAYQVARSALVPTVVRNDQELVEANSKLSLLSGIMSFVGVVPAGALSKLGGPEWAVGLAMCTFVAAAVIGLRIPATTVASSPPEEAERQELRSAGILLAASGMGVLRGLIGFLTMLVAFDFRSGPTWQLGFVGGAAVLSGLVGAAIAPRIRSFTSEENLLTAMLALVTGGALLSLVLGRVYGAALVGGCIGLAAAAGKLAFDSIVQRDAPDANRGRSFAKFETRFQVMWVIGALIPVAIEMEVLPGQLLIFGAAGSALFFYVVGRLATAHRTGTRRTAATAAAVEIEERFAEVSGEVKGRLRKGSRAAYRRIRNRPQAPEAFDEYVPDQDGHEYDDEYEPYEGEAYEGEVYDDDPWRGSEPATDVFEERYADDGPTWPADDDPDATTVVARPLTTDGSYAKPDPLADLDPFAEGDPFADLPNAEAPTRREPTGRRRPPR